jgi:hypothetical protein
MMEIDLLQLTMVLMYHQLIYQIQIFQNNYFFMEQTFENHG